MSTIKERWESEEKGMSGVPADKADEAIELARKHRKQLVEDAKKRLEEHREATEDDSEA